MAAWRTIVTAAFRPALGRGAVRRGRGLLRPGVYVHVSGRLWRHVQVAVPAPVLRTKGATAARRRSGMSRRTQAGQVVRRLVSFLEPGVVVVRRRHRHDAYTVVVAGAAGEPILLDPAKHRVARPLPSGEDVGNQYGLRRRWAGHIPAPAFVFTSSGWVIEGYAEGDELPRLSPDGQVPAYRELLRAYTRLVGGEGQESSAPILRAVTEPGVLEHLDPVATARLDPGLVRDQAGSWPLVPTFADHGGKNLLVDATGAPVVIDCMPMRLLPFFYAPLFVLARTRRLAELRAAYFAGVFDRELQVLFTAAEAEFCATKTWRETLVVATLLVRHAPSASPAPRLGPRYAARVNEIIARSGWRDESAWAPDPGRAHPLAPQ